MNDDSEQLLISSKGRNTFTKYKGATISFGATPITVSYHEPNIVFDNLTPEEQAKVIWNDEVKDDDQPASPPEGPKPGEPEGPTDNRPEEPAPESPADKGPQGPAPVSQGGGLGRRRSLRRRRGINLGISGSTDEELNQVGQNPMNPKTSLSYLRANDPEGYRVATEFNEKRKDDTAWDKLSDDVKDSYLSCLRK
jgi:hypothetical protein